MSGIESTIESAIQIASHDLRWCYRPRGIISGSRLVYWSWDSFFASFGCLRLGDDQIVKRNLELYLSFQNKHGSVPKRIANPSYFLSFLGIPISESIEKQRPSFWNTYYTAPSLAQNPIFIIAFHEYIEQSNNQEFLGKYYPQLLKIFDYLQTQESEFQLLKEGMGGGWAESVLKKGEIAFTNMCYAHSLLCMSKLARILDQGPDANQFYARCLEVREAINQRFWSEEDGGYYCDWFGRTPYHHFATDGNLLAIWWEIASPTQAKQILAKIAALSLDDDVPIKLAYDPYDFWRVYLPNRLGGLKDYHVGFSWTWLGCVDALANLRMGRKENAREILRKIAEVIVRDGSVYETYNKGKPVRTLFYKSEHPWAWGAGLFLYACHEAGFSLSPLLR